MIIPTFIKTKPFFNFEISSTPNCNMACTYCFEGEELKSKEKQSLENIPILVEKIKALLQDEIFSSEYSGITINFWGGEPTINFNWNKELIFAIRKSIPQDQIRYFFYSNGFSYSKVTQHIDLFSEEEIKNGVLRFQISWDGIEGLRVDHSGKQTLGIIRQNILKLAKNYKNLQCSTKATIQPEELLILPKIWDEFYKLFIECQEFQADFEVNFSPTLNYVDDYLTTPEYLKEIEQQFYKVAQKELVFYKKYKRHLFSWFGAESEKDFYNKRSTNCSAGIHLLVVSIQGDVSPCHGALYSPLKRNFENLSKAKITDTPKDFVKKVHDMRFSLKPELNKLDSECKTCEATVCYKCPIVNSEQHLQKKFPNIQNMDIINTFQNRDPRHCQIYKTFGPVDRALYNIKKENYE